MSYDHLFSPLQVGGLSLRNRIIHLATLTQYGHDNRVSQALINYHQARAKGGAAASVTEGLAVHPSSVPLRSVVTLFDDRANDGLKRLAAAGEEHDCRMLGQLWHVGRQQLWSPTDAPVGVSDEPDALSWTVPQQADGRLIGQLIDAFVHAAGRLQACGFSGVELHGAHGYLLTQFMSPWSNTRDDDYGGDLQRRLRFVRDVITGIREVCGDRFIVGLKMPAEEGVAGGIDLQEAAAITRHLVQQAPPDYFAYSQGNFSLSLENHNPDMHYAAGPFLQLHRALKADAGDIPVVALGRVLDAAHGEDILQQGIADLVGLGRALIADPALPEKTRSGRGQQIRPCVFGNLCWGEIHAGKPMLCINNPVLATADEADWQPQAARVAKRLVVIGAGPAGLEAAWVAAARGHQVTLFGASDSVGGALRLDAALPGRNEMAKVYGYQIGQARQHGVEMILGRRADADDIARLGADVVLLATGAEPRKPTGLIASAPIFSWRELVDELLTDTRDRPGSAVLLDMDHSDATYAFADLLAARYEKLIIITPRVQLARAAPYTNAIGIYRRLYQREVEIITASQPTRFDGHTVDYSNVFSGKPGRLQNVSLFSYSTPRVARTELAKSLANDAGTRDVRLIGDARSPRTLFSAIHEGLQQASTL